MTRKDYILIAEALRDSCEFAVEYQAEGQKVGILLAATRIANKLASDNPRFDREHFLAMVRGERELTSRPPRKRSRSAEDWAQNLADRMNTQAGDCQ